MDSLAALAHAEVFADFLEMAQHLLDVGYKDAAAVIAGSALEAHLRQLAVKTGVDTTFQDDKGATRRSSGPDPRRRRTARRGVAR